jgi:hypothetical protein
MRRNRTKNVQPSFAACPWRVEFEQSSRSGAWVYKFPSTDTIGLWVNLPGRKRSAFRTVAGVVQFIAEIHGLSGKMWRALLAQLQHTRPLPIEDVFEGNIFSANGRLQMKSMWIDDSDAVRLKALDEATLHAACDEIPKCQISRLGTKPAPRSWLARSLI